ncbi:MAG TPA: hypothetical protein VLJ39_07030, partial [Tepidisphaeraceae bacterium]|nr:hypothetical protein [Tepidisphaeraceae bacterium]
MPKADVLRNRRLRAAVVLSLAGMLNASGGFVGAAITGTWNATPTDNSWITNGTENNWNSTPGVFPGTTGTTTNGDTALFNTAVNTTAVPGGVISLSSDLNILNINFDTSAGSYTIGSLGSGGNLLLSDGGALS